VNFDGEFRHTHRRSSYAPTTAAPRIVGRVPRLACAAAGTAGILKDGLMLGGFQKVQFDFIADNPGPARFHCHQQPHMDFGFMALFKYA